MPRYEKTFSYAYAKTKAQISCKVTAQLISNVVFATKIVKSLYSPNSKFPATSHLLWTYNSLVCVWNPKDKFSHHFISVIWRTCSTVGMEDDCESQE